jgi:hypothetical protein
VTDECRRRSEPDGGGDYDEKRPHRGEAGTATPVAAA